MAAAEPRVPSYGKLAAALEKLPDWPADSKLKPRSLATLLSRLDRGQDLTWLADRDRVQLALGRVLGVPVDEIRRASGAQRVEAVDARMVRLHDLPSARPLDLLAESLPPGIPEVVLQVSNEPIWWVALPGSGKGLAGRWLSARGRTEYLEAHAAEEVDAVSGPLFVEYWGQSEAVPRARPGLCVAARLPPPLGSGFREVRSPPLLELLPSIVAWAEERLPAKSRFDPDAALQLLDQRVRAGSLHALGDALGVIGLVDELGARELGARTPARIAQRFVEGRVQRSLDPSAPFASWLRRSIYAALLGMAERALVDSELPLAHPRSFEDWLALVPPELERNVDLDWMRLSLTQIDSAIRPADVERAARRLPPGAFRVVTSLVEARLLRRDAQGRLHLEPAWLRSELERTAQASVLSRSPFEWGEALLRPHAARGLCEALLDRTLREGGAGLEAVLELEAEDQPGYAAAVDLAFRTAGVARLLGADLSQELLEGLWRENAQLSLQDADGLPLPRLEFPLEAFAVSGAEADVAEALLSQGGYYLAALSITEQLESKVGAELAVLDPWHRTKPDARLGAVYDEIAKSLRALPRWREAAVDLVSRVRAVVGNALDAEAPHELELPAQMLDEIEHGVLEFATFSHAEPERWLTPLLRLADEHGTRRSEVARAIWQAWDQAGRPDGANFLAPDAPDHMLFWGTIPEALLSALLIDARRSRVPYAAFGDEQWQGFAAALQRYPELASEHAAWVHMPSEWVSRLLTLPLDWASAPETVHVLWQRFPELLANAVRRQLASSSSQSDPHALAALLQTAPSELAATLLSELLPRVYGVEPRARHAIRTLLRRLVGERGPGWREIYATLSRLEREWRSLDLASAP
jgi:hypothetical protein